MKKFIAYFDYLGFKDFIENNDLAFQKRIMNNNFRDIEFSLSNGKATEGRFGLIGDRSECNVSCMNFSDTVVFWTEDDQYKSLLELLQVAYNYNCRSNLLTFPTKGAVVYGELVHVDFRDKNSASSTYNINSLFGKGLVEAHIKTEKQDWAGAVLDQSVIDHLNSQGIQYLNDFDAFLKEYRIPYKVGFDVNEDEFAFKLVKGKLNDEALKNCSNNLRTNFGQYNKSTEDFRVQRKLDNTIKYLESFV